MDTYNHLNNDINNHLSNDINNHCLQTIMYSYVWIIKTNNLMRHICFELLSALHIFPCIKYEYILTLGDIYIILLRKFIYHFIIMLFIYVVDVNI